MTLMVSTTTGTIQVVVLFPWRQLDYFVFAVFVTCAISLKVVTENMGRSKAEECSMK